MQSSLLAYIDVFWTLMLISLAALPLALILRTIKLGAGRHIDKQECERRSHASASG
jgi:DHA2 family multidrug resistance protein